MFTVAELELLELTVIARIILIDGINKRVTNEIDRQKNLAELAELKKLKHSIQAKLDTM